MGANAAMRAWDREYRRGRYLDEEPIRFVTDILAAVGSNAAACTEHVPGLYIGCGNGRNFVPLVEGGLDLIGIDISAVAIEQLGRRYPRSRHRLYVGDLSTVPAEQRFPVVVGIQVFQHGDRATTHTHIRDAARRVAAGGLLAIRVNAVGSDIRYAHEFRERCSDGGFTIRYQQGPKRGLDIHFFAGTELDVLLTEEFTPVLSRRLHTTPHAVPAAGQWSQWEGIWQRTRSRSPDVDRDLSHALTE